MASMRVRQSLVAAWEHGWQPLDLVHVVRGPGPGWCHCSRRRSVAQARSVQAEQRAPQAWLDQLGAVADEAGLPARRRAVTGRLVPVSRR